MKRALTTIVIFGLLAYAVPALAQGRRVEAAVGTVVVGEIEDGPVQAVVEVLQADPTGREQSRVGGRRRPQGQQAAR